MVISHKMRETLASSVPSADAFFAVETQRLRKFYLTSGNPRLTYLCGAALAQLGVTLNLKGCLGLAVLDMILAEMLIAAGSSASDMAQAETHLLRARNQLEKSDRTELVARCLGQWYMLMAVSLKARNIQSDYEQMLRTGAGDRWMLENASAGDLVPVVRQRVMMNQDLDQHIALLYSAYQYKLDRPIEYYRSIKRVIEFLTNNALTESAGRLEREFMLAFVRSTDKASVIGKVSFGRDMIQLAALKGDIEVARSLLVSTKARAESAGLLGQVRQLSVLAQAIDTGDIRGSLVQFRV